MNKTVYVCDTITSTIGYIYIGVILWNLGFLCYHGLPITLKVLNVIP